MMDRCWAFCQAYNEEVMIGYWARHYVSICERVIVYVDVTTDDRTESVARAEGAETREFYTGGALDDFGFVAFAQDKYPLARGKAEWVLWADADEILYHPRLPGRLDELRAAGVTYPHVAGYAMVADAPPTGTGHIYEEIRLGLPAREYSKPCIFAPELDVRWSPGKHDAVVTGAAIRDDGTDPLRLLHYRYLGEQWHVARNARNFARINEANRSAQHGREVYPEWQGVDQPYSPAWFRAHAAEATEVVG